VKSEQQKTVGDQVKACKELKIVLLFK